jgi:hypothetical protein
MTTIAVSQPAIQAAALRVWAISAGMAAILAQRAAATDAALRNLVAAPVTRTSSQRR